MELVNALYLAREKLGDSPEDRRVFSSAAATALTLLSPVAPHICEELWEASGHEGQIAEAAWPSWEAAATARDVLTVALQVNGRLRGTLEIEAGADNAALEAAALAEPAVLRHTAGLTVRKVIVVPGKLVNIVAG
jgi:leucyl-tRNA synthetase